MNRFFLPPEALQADQVSFPGEVSRQIYRVLRLKPGDFVAVLDNLGNEYRVELTSVTAEGSRGVILEQKAAAGEPPVRLTLYLCLTQREKFEWILQKCTETGVAGFIPVISSRSLVRDPADVENKLGRWQRIVREAAEQSGRGRIPSVSAALLYEQALRHGIAACQAGLLAWEKEDQRGLSALLAELDGLERIALLIGPEGGMSGEEVQMAVEHGWKTFSLGRRTLRMETAAVVASARLIAAVEDRPG